MQVHEAVILITVIALLVIGFAIALWQSLRKKYPEGEHVTYTHRGFEVHVIFADGIAKNSMLVTETGRAVWAAASAWREAVQAGVAKAPVSKIKEVIVRYAQKDQMMKGAAASIRMLKMREWFSYELPSATIGERSMNEVMNTGEPVIHEMMHALEGIDGINESDHTDPVVWAGARRKNGAERLSIQERAREIYIESA